MFKIILGIALIVIGVYFIKKDKLYRYFYWNKRRPEGSEDKMMNARLFLGCICFIIGGIGLILEGSGINW